MAERETVSQQDLLWMHRPSCRQGPAPQLQVVSSRPAGPEQSFRGGKERSLKPTSQPGGQCGMRAM